MNEKRKKVSSAGKFRILAAAALSAAIIGSQIPVVQASETGIIQEITSVIPENVTVENPVALADIKLPDNEFGTLEWADGSFIPDRRVQSCKAILRPAEGVDLSDLEGWDEEEGGVICHIKVIVSSIQTSEDYEAREDVSEDNISEDNTSETMEEPEETDSSSSDTSENKDGVSEKESEEEAAEEKESENGSSDEKTDKSDKIADESDEKAVLEQNAEAKLSQAETEKEESVDVQDDSEEQDAVPEEAENQKEDVHTGQPQDVLEGKVTEPSEEADNIFDNPADFTVQDKRPAVAEENLTEEEQAERAVMNHSCNGIFVSGINLPWYVQFRVSSGENYEFSNEADAAIFQSYEFELWDLQNNTEYEIPDGEYISVTIPVKEGYDYIIEHLLDNGATETIIPSVEGSIMVFSTHSLSPFGIAGSKQLVGPDFEPDISITPTPTPTVTSGAKPSQTPGGNTGGSGTGSSSGTNTGSNTNGNTGIENAGASGNVTSGSSGVNDNISGSSAAGSDGSSTQTYSDGGSESAASSETVSDGSSNSGSSSDNNAQNTGNQSDTKNKAVATGDTTAILPFVILIAAAIIIIGAVLIIKRKKK